MNRMILCVVAACVGVQVQAQVLSANVAETLAPVKTKLANGVTANVLVLGDSLSVREGSYLPNLISTLQAQYGDAGAGYQGFSLWTGAGFNSGWAKGMINADTAPHQSLDGLWASFELPTTQYYSAYFTARSEQATLHYLVHPAGGSATLTVPGTGNIVLNTQASVAEVKTLTYATPLANKQVWIYPDKNGPVTILGEVNRNARSGIIFHRAANGGWGANNFLQRDTTFDQQIKLLDLDLVIIWLGQNDQGYNDLTYEAPIEQLIDRVEADVPGVAVLLIGTYNSGSPRIYPLVQAEARLAMNNQYGFMNIYEAAGSYAFFEYMGYLDDGLHYSAAGGVYVADVLARAWNTDGASLAVCAADTNRNGSVDLDDFFLFMNMFDANSLAADVTGDGVSDLGDFFTYLTAFDIGC